MNIVADTGEATLVRATVRSIALECRRRTTADPGDDHRHCWASLRNAGFTELRSDSLGPPPYLYSLIVVEEMARSLCSAPVVAGAVLVPELLRLVASDNGDAPPIDGPLSLVLPPSLESLGGPCDKALGWDTQLTSASLGVDEGHLFVADLQAEVNSADLSRQLRRLGPGRRLETSQVGPADETRFLASARLAVAADSLGAASQVFEDAVEYAKTRIQYGQPIGGFQAVQHILAAAYVQLEAVRSSMLYASWLLDFGELVEASESALVTKAYAAAATVDVVHAAIQVFGGIAITWEHHAHRHLRRVVFNRQLFGTDEALERELAGARG